ncbi:hypothetical protein O181_008407 [Austropuccinia psidii MF-1]|uniref:Uncharacterized protein n=1 Tax=Austropuccinia psidii MF-1 TaxID=1389203 RepID=A0A9Q3BPP2_9BASI|nr:hypothetical protein [Austropuccinia psidii MF-1]
MRYVTKSTGPSMSERHRQTNWTHDRWTVDGSWKVLTMILPKGGPSTCRGVDCRRKYSDSRHIMLSQHCSERARN